MFLNDSTPKWPRGKKAILPQNGPEGKKGQEGKNGPEHIKTHRVRNPYVINDFPVDVITIELPPPGNSMVKTIELPLIGGGNSMVKTIASLL